MDTILKYDYSWMDLIVLVIILTAIYLLIDLVKRLLSKIQASSIRFSLKKIVHKLSIVYELVAVLLLISMFVIINPVFNSLVIAIILIASFLNLRNYLSGRIVLLDDSIAVGEVIQIGRIQGKIARKGRLELQIRIPEGLNHISYHRLLTEGYTMISGGNVGRFCHLNIAPVEKEDERDHLTILGYSLALTPYIDWTYKIELEPIANEHGQIEARMLLREAAHLKDLVSLITEWGYACKVISPSPANF